MQPLSIVAGMWGRQLLILDKLGGHKGNGAFRAGDHSRLDLGFGFRPRTVLEGGPIFLGLFFFFLGLFFFGSIFLVFPKKTTIPSIFLKDLMHFRGFSYEKQ